MARKMSDDEAYAFLSHGTRTGKVATVRADGRPHVAPVWFVVDGRDLVFMTGSGTVKGKSLRRDPRISLVVDVEEPPYAFVLVEGTVEISADPSTMLDLSIAIGTRYMGLELGEQFGRRNAVAGELMVRLRPDSMVAVDDMSG